MLVSNFCRLSALERTVRALGEPQTAAFSSGKLVADSISAKGLFRDVVALPLRNTTSSCFQQLPTVSNGFQHAPSGCAAAAPAFSR
eukprot:8075553-Alexandrium_andersonii.AAC.1